LLFLILKQFKENNILLKDNYIMISVLIPIYNGIEFINESVKSVLLQSFEKWELLIGVNGHLQNSEIYLKAKTYELLDKRIKVYDFFYIKGKANTLNEMIKYSKYNYIALLDVDDIWHLNKLEIQSKYLNKFDVIGSNCLYFGDIEGVIPKIPLYDISNFNFAEINPIINSSSIIKKELCNWNENGIEDYDLWLRLYKQKKQFYNCPEVLIKHRIHKQSAFNSKGNDNKVLPLLAYYGLERKNIIL